MVQYKSLNHKTLRERGKHLRGNLHDLEIGKRCSSDIKRVSNKGIDKLDFNI